MLGGLCIYLTIEMKFSMHLIIWSLHIPVLFVKPLSNNCTVRFPPVLFPLCPILFNKFQACCRKSSSFFFLVKGNPI
jgi:hypothetical protein